MNILDTEGESVQDWTRLPAHLNLPLYSRGSYCVVLLHILSIWHCLMILSLDLGKGIGLPGIRDDIICAMRRGEELCWSLQTVQRFLTPLISNLFSTRYIPLGFRRNFFATFNDILWVVVQITDTFSGQLEKTLVFLDFGPLIFWHICSWSARKNSVPLLSIGGGRYTPSTFQITGTW